MSIITKAHPSKAPHILSNTRRRKMPRRQLPPVAILLAWAYALLSVAPLLWMVMQSFRTDAQILGLPWGLPIPGSLDAYGTAFTNTPLLQYFVNSLLVTLAVVLLAVACCAGAGYAFSKLRFPGSSGVFAVFVGVLLIPAPLLLLPVFLISRDLGILNSYVGLIAPYAAGALPIGVWLIKTHFDSVPDSFSEAAELDRATPFQVFWHVMLPLVKPAAATVAVLTFMTAWNEYIYALVAIRNAELFTLPIGIADLNAKKFLYGYAPVFAAMVLTSVPVYAAFLAAQRSFINSLTLGGGVKA
ncbi:carbohydrate ABC transporter permease [Pseudarthrobacter sp. 1C304]|uniref:carbohydrate ABC transporter permease n=1 Tax=Pseudarthrobacter sp. 1C304 TaxID=3457438 RepID=UPI003FD54FBC